jgi:hypothetical protein
LVLMLLWVLVPTPPPGLLVLQQQAQRTAAWQQQLLTGQCVEIELPLCAVRSVCNFSTKSVSRVLGFWCSFDRHCLANLKYAKRPPLQRSILLAVAFFCTLFSPSFPRPQHVEQQQWFLILFPSHQQQDLRMSEASDAGQRSPGGRHVQLSALVKVLAPLLQQRQQQHVLTSLRVGSAGRVETPWNPDAKHSKDKTVSKLISPPVHATPKNKASDPQQQQQHRA